MSDLNSVQICGRIVRDAVMKETAGGTRVAEFSIATNITYRDGDGEFVQKGHFFPLALYGQYAGKMLPHLKKGQRVIIEGYLRQNRWTTGDGRNRSETAVGVRTVHLIFDGKKGRGEGNEAGNPAESSTAQDSPAVEGQMQGMYEPEPEGTDFFTEGGDYPGADFEGEDFFQ